tara:strand:+ start:146 stop:385 length:240 start_codon:yes stop_codon:yes gene_type:complete
MTNKWSSDSGKLIKTFNFSNFKEALKFINQVGEVSERLNHHPKITNVYNKVSFELWTHDKNSITELDHELATEIDKLLN